MLFVFVFCTLFQPNRPNWDLTKYLAEKNPLENPNQSLNFMQSFANFIGYFEIRPGFFKVHMT